MSIDKGDDPIILIVNSTQLKYMGLCIIAFLFLLIPWLIDDYKDKHNECRIYQNNIEADILGERVVVINENESFIYLKYINDSTQYFFLDKVLIDSVRVGDIIRKDDGSNQALIIRGNQRIFVPFARIPEKKCKEKIKMQ